MIEAVYRTVRGDVPVGDVGPALFHEHLISDASAWNRDPDLRCVNPALVTAELRTAAADGVGLLVDATPIDFGRDPAALAQASARSGMHVIAGTGFYREISYPAWLDDWDEERLARRFVDDIVIGPDGCGIRAGVIGEVGSSSPMTVRERRVLAAAAIAQQCTGAAIISHTQEGHGALEQLEFLLGHGADPARVVVGHLDCAGDVRLAIEVIGLGANVGYDRIGLTQYVSDEQRAADIVRLVEAGHADRVMLSGDQARPSQYRANGGDGFGKVLVRFVPLLRQRGLPDATIDQLLVANPRRVLGLSRAASVFL
jgi:phosphotriesterase-related protein